MSAGGAATPAGTVSRQRSTVFTRAVLYVELAARGLASVSQTAIVWLVMMVTIVQSAGEWLRRPVLG